MQLLDITEMNLSMDWFGFLNLVSTLITLFGALTIFFRKSLEKYKQSIASINKRLRFKRIKKLRRQYFWIASIEKDQILLISFVSRQILFSLVFAITMLFIGFIFLYLDKGFLKLLGGIYLLLLYFIFIKHLDEIMDVLVGLKSPDLFKNEKRAELKQLRMKKI
jgi:hypothetical protein